MINYILKYNIKSKYLDFQKEEIKCFINFNDMIEFLCINIDKIISFSIYEKLNIDKIIDNIKRKRV